MAKFNLIKVNQELEVYATGKRYVVSEKLEENNRIYGYLLLPKDEEDTEARYLTEQNAEAFRFVYDPNPVPVPEGEFTADNGILLRDGTPVTDNQGELFVEDVLGVIPGAVVIAVKDEDDAVTGCLYNPYMDEFIHLGMPVSRNLKVVTGDEKYALLADVLTEIVEEKDDDGNVTKKELLFGSTLDIVTRKGVCARENIAFVPDGDVQTVGQLVFFGGTMLLFGDEPEGMCDFEDFEAVNGAEINGRVHAYIAMQHGRFAGVFGDVPGCKITESPVCGFLFMNDEFMRVGKTVVKTPVLRQFADTPYLIKEVHDGDETRYVFASDEAEPKVKVLVRTKTKDRGFIYTVK